MTATCPLGKSLTYAERLRERAGSSFRIGLRKCKEKETTIVLVVDSSTAGSTILHLHITADLGSGGWVGVGGSVRALCTPFVELFIDFGRAPQQRSSRRLDATLFHAQYVTETYKYVAENSEIICDLLLS